MESYVAFLTGAGIIAFFSFSRFDRVTDQGGRRLERVVKLLSPNNMRERRIIRRAYFFYASALLLIYVFMCVYADLLPIFQEAGEGGTADDAGVGANSAPDGDPATAPVDGNQDDQKLAGPSNTKDDDGGLIAPTTSLTMALIITGLAPGFPLLNRVETWIRYTAHRLAGIPTQVIELARKIEHSDLKLPPPEGDNRANTLLIPRPDWQSMAEAARLGEQHLTAPSDFTEDLRQIYAFKTWILKRKLDLDENSSRRAFSDLEESLQKRADALSGRLHEIIKLQPQDDQETAETRREQWDGLAEEAKNLSEDLHFLLALFVEHGILDMRDEDKATLATQGKSDTGAETDKAEQGQDSQRRQRARARQVLIKFIEPMFKHHSGTKSPSMMIGPVLFWATSVVMVIQTLWFVWPGWWEFELQFDGPSRAQISWYGRFLNVTSASLNQIVLPILIAIVIWEGARQTGRWNNLTQYHWTHRWPQAVVVIGSAWLVAISVIVGLALLQSGIKLGFGENSEDSWASLRAIFEYNAPMPLRGAILAWLVLRLLDLHENADISGPYSVWLAIKAALVMALVGLLTRLWMSWNAIAANKRYDQDPRDSLDAIDRGLAAYGAIQMALIGFFVIYCLSEVKRVERYDGKLPKRAKTKALVARAVHSLNSFRQKGMGMRLWPLALVLLAAPEGHAQPIGAMKDKPIIIGVRDAVRPYVWKDSVSNSHTGFLWDICNEAVRRAGYETVKPKTITLEERRRIIEGEDLGIDLLCDPTTITLGRMHNLLGSGNTGSVRFSPIVFVTNAAHFQQPKLDGSTPGNIKVKKEEKDDKTKAEDREKLPDCTEIIDASNNGGWKPKTTVRYVPPFWKSWIGMEKEDEDLLQMKYSRASDGKSVFYEVWGYVGSTTADKTVEKAKRDEKANRDEKAKRDEKKDVLRVCPRPFDTHEEAARAFCEKRIARYFGDVEIIRAALQVHRSREGVDCKAKLSPRIEGSYEPYALIMSPRKHPHLPDQLTYALYGMFSDLTVQRTFNKYFDENSKNLFLDSLFRTNRLPPGRSWKNSVPANCSGPFGSRIRSCSFLND